LLLSSRPLGDETYSMISQFCKIALYMLDDKTKDVHHFAGTPNPDLPAVVIRYTSGHYELVSIKSRSSDYYYTHFHPSHPFIKFLQSRIRSFKS
jgi:hypothetical protein